MRVSSWPNSNTNTDVVFHEWRLMYFCYIALSGYRSRIIMRPAPIRRIPRVAGWRFGPLHRHVLNVSIRSLFLLQRNSSEANHE
jgi:hypothetical protein